MSCYYFTDEIGNYIFTVKLALLDFSFKLLDAGQGKAISNLARRSPLSSKLLSSIAMIGV